MAGTSQLLSFRSVMTALTQSLPRICSTDVTANDIGIAALDLRHLAVEAEAMRATDVAATLAVTIEALLNQSEAVRLLARKDGLPG
jgi:hypothetical protein